MVQLAAWILPLAVLPIALSIALLAIIVGGAREATEIKFGRSRLVPSVVELVRTPSSIETTYVVTKISKRLAMSKEDYKRGVGCGQPRCIDDSKPHGWKGCFVKEFMC